MVLTKVLTASCVWALAILSFKVIKRTMLGGLEEVKNIVCVCCDEFRHSYISARYIFLTTQFFTTQFLFFFSLLNLFLWYNIKISSVFLSFHIIVDKFFFKFQNRCLFVETKPFSWNIVFHFMFQFLLNNRILQ